MAVRLIKIVGNLLGAVWIVGGSVFFFARFSMVFYHAHQASIDGVLQRLW